MPRISPAWVEHKCVLCGAVYETPGPDDRELCDDCDRGFFAYLEAADRYEVYNVFLGLLGRQRNLKRWPNPAERQIDRCRRAACRAWLAMRTCADVLRNPDFDWQ